MTIDSVIYIIVVIYSIVLHEVAHGYVAKWCGDNTADRAGRLTFNPAPHIDTVGSVIVPVMGVMSGFGVFGWAKGVPVNFYNLNSRLKEFFVSVAGITTNLILATLFLILIKISSFEAFNFLQIYKDLFLKIAVVNIGLGFFNLLPIPPFDGMQIMRSIFPSLKHRYQAFEHNPVAMVIAILVASYLFSFIYRPLLNFIFSIFF